MDTLLDGGLGPMLESTRRYLHDLRAALLHLHKALLEIERIDYEQAHGRVSAGELLKLVIQHEQFSWLRSISETVVRVDELLDEEESPAEGDVRQLLAQTRSLLVPAESGDRFARQYYLALQRDPATVLAHRAVSQILVSALKAAE